jgi:hypothetical protein
VGGRNIKKMTFYETKTSTNEGSSGGGVRARCASLPRQSGRTTFSGMSTYPFLGSFAPTILAHELLVLVLMDRVERFLRSVSHDEPLRHDRLILKSRLLLLTHRLSNP